MVAEADWRLVVKVEHPVDLVKVYLKEEDGGKFTEMLGIVEGVQLRKHHCVRLNTWSR